MRYIFNLHNKVTERCARARVSRVSVPKTLSEQSSRWARFFLFFARISEGSRLLTVRGILHRSVWRVCSLAGIQTWALKSMGARANGYPHAIGRTRVRSATMEHNAQDNERELCPVIICNLDFIIARCADACAAVVGIVTACVPDTGWRVSALSFAHRQLSAFDGD